MATRQNPQSNNPIAGIIGVAVMILIVYLLFKVVSGVISIMYGFLGPILLVIALILNYRVVLNYIQWLAKMVKKDTLKGLAYTGLSIVGYPFVSAWLFLKAFLKFRLKRNVNKQEKTKEKEFVEYEEITEEEDFLELPDLEKPKETNRYDDLFE